SSYKYFEGSSFCPGCPRPTSTSEENSARAWLARVEVANRGALAIGLFLHATERSVCVWVVRLKPISERSTHHASIRARRATLHYEMFAIEEIRRISAIERKGPK